MKTFKAFSTFKTFKALSFLCYYLEEKIVWLEFEGQSHRTQEAKAGRWKFKGSWSCTSETLFQKRQKQEKEGKKIFKVTLTGAS